jgi:L-threonylcarbamoyladenylate synthase
MRILKATLENIRVAAKVVKEGGLVVYPTDTVYGLGCDPFNVDAVERLIAVKGSRDKALPILAYSLGDVERVAGLSERARKVGERFWPRPLTLVLPKKFIPDVVTFGLGTVGVRVPNHKVALELLKLCGGLLVGTSANKSGCEPPCTAVGAFKQLGGEVDMVLDGGVAEFGVSSTVVDLTGGVPRLLRRGVVSFDRVLEFWDVCVRHNG